MWSPEHGGGCGRLGPRRKRSLDLETGKEGVRLEYAAGAFACVAAMRISVISAALVGYWRWKLLQQEAAFR